MSSRRHIAIDLGASSGRVMEVVLGDGELSVRELHRFANAPVTARHAGAVLDHCLWGAPLPRAPPPLRAEDFTAEAESEGEAEAETADEAEAEGAGTGASAGRSGRRFRVPSRKRGRRPRASLQARLQSCLHLCSSLSCPCRSQPGARTPTPSILRKRCRPGMHRL